ncbi:MAG TPA: hypothetical protein VIV54_08675 [Burkholderiales bacterium]
MSALIERLNQLGVDSSPLASFQARAYTTSTELLGELGRALSLCDKKRIKADPHAHKLFKELKSTASKAWG